MVGIIPNLQGFSWTEVSWSYVQNVRLFKKAWNSYRLGAELAKSGQEAETWGEGILRARGSYGPDATLVRVEKFMTS